MKILIVFYSLTGNTKKVAQAIAAAVKGEILEIKLKKPLPNRGFSKYFWGGKQVVWGESPELLPLGKNPADYDMIFLGTPVWAGDFAPAVRSFLSQAKLADKKVALFCAHGGDDPGKTFADLGKELAGNDIIGRIDLKMDMITPAKLSDNLRKAAAWGETVATQ